MKWLFHPLQHARRRQHPEPQKHFRDVRTAFIEDSGHWLHHDQPEAVLAELRAFFGSTGG